VNTLRNSTPIPRSSTGRTVPRNTWFTSTLTCVYVGEQTEPVQPALAMMNHPNIAKVLDAVTTAVG